MMKMNRKLKWSAALCAVILCGGMFSGCSTESTAENASLEALYEADHTIDLFVWEDTAYVNADDVEWVQAMDLQKGEEIGTIQNTGVTEDFQDWDATVLAEDTVIYESDASSVLLAEVDGSLVPYLAYVEG